MRVRNAWRDTPALLLPDRERASPETIAQCRNSNKKNEFHPVREGIQGRIGGGLPARISV